MVSDAEITDELPEDLDITGLVGPYVFPNTNRRRLPGLLYLVLGAICVGVAVAADGSPRINTGVWIAAIALLAVGGFSIVTAWNTAYDESDALAAAAAVVGFPVRHASAQMNWRGWRSAPVWRILAFSCEDQPTKRALVLVDARSGSVIEHFTEDNPEDWTELDDA